MTVKMSSEGDASKNLSSETNEKSGTDHTDSSQDSQDADLKSTKQTTENNTEADDTDSKEKAEAKEEASEDEDKPDAAEIKKQDDEEKANDVDKKEKKEDKENDATEEEGENSEKTEEEDDDASDKESNKAPKEKGKKDVPLLDQPLEKSGKRERKNVERFHEAPVEKDTKFEIPNGSGTALGEIPRIDASISRFKNDDLKMLHKILFKTVGKTNLVKKNIKKFNGFEFKKDAEEYAKKLSQIQKLDTKNLKSICEMLDLPKTGSKDDVSERILTFLLEPADSGKPVGGGRPKRSAAVKANNRGYSSHDDYSSDEKPSRARRDKGKRTSLKDATSSESDEEFQPSDGSDEKPRVNKRKRVPRKKAKSDDEQSDEPAHSGGGSSDESEDEAPKGKRRKSVKTNNKAKGKATPAKRGRKPAATPKKTPKSAKRKAKESSEEENDQSDHKDDAGSSSEDEPLVKKTKNSNPPTDDEIKTYIKEILEGANLEEITMKNVCQQVYAHYPDFDLAHKKDFIKSTVKSLIST